MPTANIQPQNDVPQEPRACSRRDWCKSIVAGLLVATTLAACGCAKYRFGQSALYSPEIHTVYVPMFESDSFRRQLGERMTEAVCKQIETSTPFKVVNDPNADTVLIGRIVNDTKRLVVNNRTGDVRDSELNFQIEVSWQQRQGAVIREQAMALPGGLVDLGNASDLIPEYGRSTATTQQTMIDNLAAQIVGLMEVDW